MASDDAVKRLPFSLWEASLATRACLVIEFGPCMHDRYRTWHWVSRKGVCPHALYNGWRRLIWRGVSIERSLT